MEYMDLDTYLQIGGMEENYKEILKDISFNKTGENDIKKEIEEDIFIDKCKNSQLLKLYILKLEIYSGYKYSDNLLTDRQKFDELVKYYKDKGKTDKDIYDLIVNNDLGIQK